MKLQIPPTVPANHPARLGQDGVLFIGRARNLSQRLDALDAIAAAKVPSQQIPHLQDIDASAPHYTPGNGKPMEQLDFARFLEDHAAELTAPMDGERDIYERLFKERFATPSDLLALSRGLEIHVGAKVKRAERLQTGERTIEFVEEHMNANGEKVEIPGIFIVSVQAFVDGEPVRIPARLRYRLQGGIISWFYQLYRWEFFIRERVQEDLRKAGQETSLPTYEGNPEK